MGPAKRKPKPKSKPKPKPKPKASRTAAPATRARTFATELASLLRSRRIAVPRGLIAAPPEAYGNLDASRVEMFADTSDDVLLAQAVKVAGWSSRQRDRAKAEWDASPLVAELKRRKLTPPRAPRRPVGASIPLSRPLSEWTDAQLLRAATDWSERGG